MEATGIIAVEQLARGIFAIGPLSLGVVALGHLATGVRWGAGMVDVGGTSGGLLGAGTVRQGLVLFDSAAPSRAPPRRPFRRCLPLPFLPVCALWVVAVEIALAHGVTRDSGILKDPIPVVPTTVSGPKVMR